MKKYILTILICSCLFTSLLSAQTNFTSGNVVSNLQSFSIVNGQWIAVLPINNTLGANYYQGVNFGFDANNYMSIVNPISTNEIYFGRWDYQWKGWNKIWHSGNLNNINSDFSANLITSNQINSGKIGLPTFIADTKLSFIQSYNVNETKAIKMFYQGSWGTPSFASNFRYIDISSTEEGNIFQLNAYGLGIGYNPPSYGSNDRLYINGNVGIGTINPGYKLDVIGTIRSREVKVDLLGADFVFEKDYKLMPLNELEKFIRKQKHLPEIATAKQMETNGVELGKLNSKLLQKTEELTLYIIEQNKKIELIEKNQNEKIKVLEDKIEKMSNKSN
jgi:hypothetical protein